MRLAWRSLVLVTGVALLSACNVVISEKPWFSAQEAKGVPALREGLWAEFIPTACNFDPQLPADAWPDCVRTILVRSELYVEAVDKSGQSTPLPHLLVAGDPLIDQIGNPRPSTEPDDRQFGYFYAGTRIVRTDDHGRIVELVRWPVVCGPLLRPGRRDKNPSLEAAEAEQRVTAKPFPGLTISGDFCLANSAADLRHAAKLSEEMAPANGSALVTWRWFRDSLP